MMMRRAPLLALLLVAACGGGTPVTPTPPPGGGGGNQQPPNNNLPVIDAITIQGSREKEPANFADAGETVALSARVHDDETAADQLIYEWSATLGTFAGTGASVTWTAPAAVPEPISVTVTLKVTEKYGPPSAPQGFSHDVSSTAMLSLHDSVREVGGMSRQFLLDFSDSRMGDVAYIMRNFSRARCPQPSEVDSETVDVTNNRKNFQITESRIGDASVTVGFGGSCPFRGRLGDACASIPSYWKSIDRRDNSRVAVDGKDIVAAAYAPQDSRWWLCASDYDGHNTLGGSLRGFIR